MFTNRILKPKLVETMQTIPIFVCDKSISTNFPFKVQIFHSLVINKLLKRKCFPKRMALNSGRIWFALAKDSNP